MDGNDLVVDRVAYFSVVPHDPHRLLRMLSTDEKTKDERPPGQRFWPFSETRIFQGPSPDRDEEVCWVPHAHLQLQLYLVTFNSKAEFDWVQSTLKPSKRYFIGGARSSTNIDQWLYTGGVEKGELIYEHSTGKCPQFCDWAPSYPNTAWTNTNGAKDFGPYMMYDTVLKKMANTDASNAFGYVLEYDSNDDPIVPVLTTAGGELEITGLSKWNTAQITVTITNGAKAPYTCARVSSDATSYVCDLLPGTGLMTITITDTKNTYTNKNYQYQLPHIRSVYPGKVKGNIVTVVGSSFGATGAGVTVVIGDSNVKCDGVTMLTPHESFTCTMTDVTTLVLPINITVGGQYYHTSRIAFYDKENVKFIRAYAGYASYGPMVNSIYSGQPLEGQLPYMGVPQSLNQFQFIKTSFPWSEYLFGTAWVGINSFPSNNPAGVYFNATNSPYDGQIAMSTNGKCVSPNIGCPASVQYGANGNFVYDYFSSYYKQSTSTSGELIFYGQVPKLQATSHIFNTTGGNFVAHVKFNGFEYTNRTCTLGSTVCQAQRLGSDMLLVVIPAGTGASKPLTISIESIALTGRTVSFYSPYIESIPNEIPTEGGPITVRGLNFGNDKSLISMTVGGNSCTNLDLIEPHAVFTCQVPAGTGQNLPVIITVDQQTQSNPSTISYIQPPTIISITQFEDILTIIGNNFGDMLDMITVNASGLSADETSILTLPDGTQKVIAHAPYNARNGPISIAIEGVWSKPVHYDYVPSINHIAPVAPSGGVLSISGYFMNSLRANGTDTVIQVLIDSAPCASPSTADDGYFSYMLCTVPAGTGEHSVQVIIDNVASTLTPWFYEMPTITGFTQSDTTITIQGTHFGTDKSTILVDFDKWIVGGKVQPTEILSNPEAIVATIPITAKNGEIVVSINGVEVKFELALIPVITEVVQSATDSKITATGYFFSNRDISNNVLEASVTVGPFTCDSAQYTSTKIVCTSATGTGMDLPFVVTIAGLSGSAQFTFLPPTLTSLATSGTTLVVTGTGFGVNASAISADPAFDLVNINPTTITYTINPSAMNGDFWLIVDLQPTNKLMLNIRPSVQSVQGVGPAGGQVTIQGVFLSSVHRDGIPAVSSVTIGSSSCDVIPDKNTSQMVCTLPASSFNKVHVFVTIDGLTSVENVFFSTLAPVINYATSLPYKTEGQITVFGNNFYTPVQIKIGSTVCKSPIFQSAYAVECTLPANAGGNQMDTLPVTATVLSLDATANVFMYQQAVCGDCGEHGTCQNGFCLCTTGSDYEGENCSTPVTSAEDFFNPVQETDTSTYTIGDAQMSYGISHLREVTPSGESVADYDLSTVLWTPVMNNMTTAVWTGKMIRLPMVLTMTLQTFDADTNANFVGEIIPVDANTHKVSYTVAGWSFADSANKLQVIYKFLSSSNTSNACDQQINTVYSTLANSAGDIQSLTTTTQKGFMVTRFGSRAQVDSSVAYTQVKFLDHSDTIYVESQHPTLSLEMVVINIPSFTTSATIDPTFRAFATPVGECNKGGKKSRKWVIPVAVIVPIVGAAAIGAGIFVIIKKKRNGSL
eukprot:gene8398-9879_t